MIYMVEMDFRDPAREHDWHTWYLAHTAQLVRNVPGFTATQRFRALTPTPSPWLAMHEVAGPEVFESKEYKANGGPASTGEWKDRHSNWYRNLFSGSGYEQTPDVAFDQHIVVADENAEMSVRMAKSLAWGKSAGLDKTVEKRGYLVLKTGELKAQMFGSNGFRIFKPITPRITK